MSHDMPSRRRDLLAAAVVFGGLAPSVARGAPAAVDQRTSLHQQVGYPVAPRRIYETLLSSKDFAAFSGLPAKIDPRVGGGFQMFRGQIEGVIVELVPDARIVQAWRPVGDFAPGVFTLVRFALAKAGSGTKVTLDQTGIPPGHYGHLASGWYANYWTPLKKVLT